METQDNIEILYEQKRAKRLQQEGKQKAAQTAKEDKEFRKKNPKMTDRRTPTLKYDALKDRDAKKPVGAHYDSDEEKANNQNFEKEEVPESWPDLNRSAIWINL